jgi:hypothetical protein
MSMKSDPASNPVTTKDAPMVSLIPRELKEYAR